MGLYYSIWDWYNPYWPKEQQSILSKGSMAVNFKDANSKNNKFSNEEIQTAQKGLDKYIDKVMLPQLKQIVTNYEPALLFSDGDWWMDYKKWRTLPFLSWALNNAPNKEELVFNDRWGKVRGKHGGITPQNMALVLLMVLNPGKKTEESVCLLALIVLKISMIIELVRNLYLCWSIL